MLTILFLVNGCVKNCDEISSNDVTGFYYPTNDAFTEYLYLKPNMTYLHVQIFHSDTLIYRGNWETFKNSCNIGISNMRWPNRYLMEAYGKRTTYALFKWNSGELDMGIDDLNFIQRNRKPSFLPE